MHFQNEIVHLFFLQKKMLRSENVNIEIIHCNTAYVVFWHNLNKIPNECEYYSAEFLGQKKFMQ